MMPASYERRDGSQGQLDLDAVFDIVAGASGLREGWTGLVVFDPASRKFVELADSPQDVRGNSEDIAVEVSDQYLIDHHGLSANQIEQARSQPKNWQFIDNRKRPNIA